MSLQRPVERDRPAETANEAAKADEWLLDRDSDVRPTLSIVMPTLDEEQGVGECIDRAKCAIAELGMYAEIVLSDSSDDRTPDIGREKGAIVVEPDEPGYGYAYRYAFERTRGEYVVMGDADTTYDFRAIPRLLHHLESERADVVMGSRLDGEMDPGAMPALHRYVGNPLLTRFLNGFYGADVSDAHSGFRILTREALSEMDLTTTGMEFASEMIMEAGAKDLEVVEVPITYHERVGEETLESFRDGWRHVRFMLVNAPGYLFSLPGLALVSTGVVIMLLSALTVPVGGVALGLNAMIAGSLLTIAGYQVFGFGVLTTVAGDPIRSPTDPLTSRIVGALTLERGATVGCVGCLVGAAYSGATVVSWATAGLPIDPVTSLLAFTAVVLGLQTVFSSFCLSAIAGE